MPQIPMYDAPLVRAAGLPNAGLNVQAPNLGAAIGQGVQQASGIIAQVQEKARAEADQTVVLQKLNALQQYRNGMDEQMQKLVGSDIQDPDKWGGEKGQAFADFRTAKTSEQLGLLSQDMTPKQKQMFDQHAIPALESDRHRSTMHEFEQIQKVKVYENERSIVLQGDAADKVVDPSTGQVDWTRVEDARFQADQAGRRIAALKGTDPDEEAKKAVAYVVNRASTAMLKESKSADATKLVESYGDTMTPEARDILLERAKKINDHTLSRTVSSEVIQAYTDPQKQTISITEAEAAIESDPRLAGNEVAIELATKALHAKIASQKNDWEQSNSSLAGDLLIHLGKRDQSQQQIESGILASALPKAQQEKLLEHTNQWFKADEAHRRQMGVLAKQELRDKQEFNLSALFLNRDKVLALNNDQILGLVGDIGTHGLDRLIHFKQVLEDRSNGGEVHFDARLVKKYTFDLGWMDNKGKVLPSKVEEFNSSQEELVSAIRQKQQELKRPLTAAESNEKVREVMQPTRARVEAGFLTKAVTGFLKTTSEAEGPAYKYTPAQRLGAISMEQKAEFSSWAIGKGGWDPLAFILMEHRRPDLYVTKFSEWENMKRDEVKRAK